MRVPFHDDHSNECYVVFVSAVMMSGYGGWIGGHIMPRVQLPAVTPKHNAWNKGRIMGQALVCKKDMTQLTPQNILGWASIV